MYEDERFVYHLMENGANGYLLKNAEPNEIRRAIMEVYEKTLPQQLCEPHPAEEVAYQAESSAFIKQRNHAER